MKHEKFKVTSLERAWILYDVGNSAFVLMIATLAVSYTHLTLPTK